MPVSHSEKMEASVLGCRLNEKTEHLPIKKRRFLFRDSSPPPTTASSQGTAASSTVADLHQSSNSDSKADGEKVVKASENENKDQVACKNNTADCEGSGIVSHDMKNLEPVEYKANSVKLENMSVKKTDFHISPAYSKNVDSCTRDHSSLDKATVDEPTLDNSCLPVPSESECSRMNKVTSETQNSADLDDRLNWDLNTVMTAWEEPLESEGKTSKSVGCELQIKCEIAAENIENEVLPNLTPKIEASELEECKSSIKPLSDINVPVPSTHTLKYPVCEISTEHVNVNNKVTGGLSHPMTASTGFSLDYNIPPIIDPYISIQAYQELVSSKIVGNRAVSTGTVRTTENDKLNLSLVTAGSLENGDEDNKSKVKRVITYSRITMENLIGKGTENVFSPKFGNNVENSITTVQINENQKLKLSLATATSPENGVGVHQSEENTFDEDDKAKVKRVISTNQTENIQDHHKPDCKQVNQAAENKDQLDAVSSKHDVACSDADVAIKSGKLPFSNTKLQFPNDVASCSKEVFNHENFQAGSEVDNVNEPEPSFGYDSQFEDGEFRESSIQTWEGNEEEIKENRVALITHENASISAPESSSRIRSTEIGSQKGAGTDEISSVLLPEKLENSDQVSGSEPNETGNNTTEVNMKDASQSDQWKMNVSGSDILPENQSSTSNISNIKDLSGIKFSSRIAKYCPETEDVETKADGSRLYRREPTSRVVDPLTRDGILSRGRFRLHGSSSNNADDSPSRSIRDSGVLRSSSSRRGPHIRSPPFTGPSFRRSLHEDIASDDNVTRQSFRSRLPPNPDEDEFRARLGLRPSGDTCHNRFVNVGPRGRTFRYSSRNNEDGPRGRYYGPANDEFDEPSIEYSHSLPVRRRCFSGSTSPQRSRTRSPINDGFRRRSRSPNFRPDTRIRRQRSPDYGHGFEPNLEPSPRWVKYKPLSTGFDWRSPPPIGERLGFYDSSRKPKQNENYRSGPPERFSDEGTGGPRYVGNDGYRQGGFVRRYDMDRPVKHVQYDEEDNYGPVYDSRGNGNSKPYSNGTESRFRDLPRRPRDERENW